MDDTQDKLTTRIRVPFEYPVFFTRGVFSPDNLSLANWVASLAALEPVRCLAFVDDGLATARPDIVANIAEYAAAHDSVLRIPQPAEVLTGGEEAKNSFDVVEKVIRVTRLGHLCRQSCIVAVGGGAFLDAVGFAASLIHRGVRLIRVPTTVLAQNDSGVGVKNGVNLGGKNFLGTFAPPVAVFNDFDMLRTLHDRDWIAGIAEAFKVAIVKDERFLHWLAEHAPALRGRDEAAMEHLIRRCAELHTEHIATSGDPFEFGSARPLDFGHWAAHKLESLSYYELRHGEAVAVGMAVDLLYAASLGFIEHDDAAQVIEALAACGLPVWHERLAFHDRAGRRSVFQGIQEFREHLGGLLHITLPRPLGAKVEVTEMDEARLDACLVDLEALAAEFGGRV